MQRAQARSFMRDLRIFGLPAAFAALGAVAVVACDDAPMHDFGGYAPYDIGQSNNSTEPGAPPPAAPDAGKDAATRSDGGGTQSGSSAGDGGGDDGGVDEASTPLPAFADAGPYVPDAGPLTLMPQHNFAGNTPTTNPSKQTCLDCHKVGGPGIAFVFAGSVFTDATGSTPAAGVEVRVRDPNGTYASVYSDAYGNFFDSNVSADFPAKTGARNAANESLMTGDATGNCNSCHNGTAQAYIHVP
jgi:hypothetical protein